MSVFWFQHQAGLLIFIAALLLIVIGNRSALRRIDSYPPPDGFLTVSVLLPARDEAANIEPCLRSLLAQDYPDYEVLVLDDHSRDGTAGILQAVLREARSKGDHRLRVLQGRELPEGWLGKHWACQQLADSARGELLLFTDADTRHHPSVLRDAVSAILAEKADLLTALPQEEVVSWGEKLIVPILPWSLFTFRPAGIAQRMNWPGLAAAVGQFMLFKREAYAKIGGHAAVRAHAADDLALGRGIVACRLRLCLVDGSRRIRCRMYHSFSQAFDGLSKNLFAAFGYHPWLFVSIWIWLGIVFLEPLAVLLFSLAGFPLPYLSPELAAIAAGLSLLLWGIFCQRFGYPLYQALLYPFTIVLTLSIAFHSLYLTNRGRARWKGRNLPPVQTLPKTRPPSVE